MQKEEENSTPRDQREIFRLRKYAEAIFAVTFANPNPLISLHGADDC